MFKVIVRFVDLKDGNHIYNVGDVFPRIGKIVSEARINELKGSSNKRGMPLIAEVVEQKPAPKPVEEAVVEEQTEPVEAEIEEQVEPVEEKKAPRKSTSRKKK